MIIRPGSYASGFAPRDFSPKYPNLWKGLIGAWCPGLGPTGATLRDWGGKKHHGTLTSLTLANAWVPQQGPYSLTPSGGYVSCGDIPEIYALNKLTIAFWCYPLTISSQTAFVSKWDYIGQGTWALQQGQDVNGKINWFIATSPGDGGGGCRVDTTTAPMTTGNWIHVGAVFDGTGTPSVSFYINGISVPSVLASGAIPSALTSATAALEFGRFQGLGRNFDGYMDDIFLWNRVVSPNEMQVLARRRGIAYEANRARIIVPTFNYDVDITESAAAGDAPSVTIDFHTDVTESAGAGDSSIGLEADQAIITESAVAGDSAAVFVAKFASITESATAGDSSSSPQGPVVCVQYTGGVFRISAPYPGTIVTSILPAPEYNEPWAGQSEIVKHVSRNGTIRTYVVEKERIRLSLTFKALNPLKLLELQALLRAYHANEFLLEMPWKLNRLWRGYLVTNPSTLTQNARFTGTVTLDFDVKVL